MKRFRNEWIISIERKVLSSLLFQVLIQRLICFASIDWQYVSSKYALALQWLWFLIRTPMETTCPSDSAVPEAHLIILCSSASTRLSLILFTQLWCSLFDRIDVQLVWDLEENLRDSQKLTLLYFSYYLEKNFSFVFKRSQTSH